MSVIDNKLINYGNLAEFHSKIIDDSSVSNLATWSSQLINNELADKQDVLTAGVGIQISGNTISATGGGAGGDAIEDVQALPDASANKNKFVRLASDKKVYVSECSTSTEEVNAPDSEQIDNAYIDVWDCRWIYKGAVTLYASNGTFNCYAWEHYNEDASMTEGLLTSDSANEINENTIYYSSVAGGLFKIGDNEWASKVDYFYEELDAVDTSNLYSDVEYIHIVKETVTTETWAWQPLTDNATNDDIDLMFDTPESPVVKRVLMKDSEDYGYSINEGWINFNDETMSYDGGTYYKWLKYSENRAGEAVQDGNFYMLTDTLNPTLPFDVNSNECVFDFEIESEGVTYRIESNETYSKIALIHEDGSITYEE